MVQLSGKDIFPEAAGGYCTALQPLGVCCTLLPLHFTIHSVILHYYPTFYDTFYIFILPLTLLKCPQFNFTIHSGCMLYTIPLHFTIHLLPLPLLHNVHSSFSTGGDFHQPGSSHLYIQEMGAVTRSRSRSSSTSSSQQEYLQPIPVQFRKLNPPKPPYFIHLSMDTWLKRKLSVPDLILYDDKGRVVFVFEVCKKSCIPYFAFIIALHFHS